MYSSDKKIFAFVLLCTIVLALFGYTWKQRTHVPFVTVPLANVTQPFVYGSNRFLYGFRTGIAVIDNALSKYEVDGALLNEVATARQTTADYNELVSENMRLRQLLQYKTTHPQFDVTMATIQIRDIGSGMNTYVIDVGSEEGIAPYMPVVAPGGVVGFISDVYAHSARVQTMLDPRTAIGVLVQRPESRVASIVKGNIANSTAPQMVDVPKEADVLNGDTLVTSGYGGIYPKGLLVGHVVENKTDSEGYVKNSTVDPSVNFNSLEEVFVITHSRESAPVWEKQDLKLVPQTQRDQVEGVKGAIANEKN